ncbi:MAG TPA: secretion system protein [Geobacter sp.]|nr:secretion system protein [Geobacter sp.]
MLYLITVSIFVSVLLLGIAVSYHFLAARSTVARRLESFFPAESETLAREPESGTWDSKLRRIGERVKLPEKERSKYMKMLVAAGHRRDSVYLFFGSKVLLACGLPSLYILFFVAPRSAYFSTEALIAMAVCAIIGYLLPSYWLYSAIKKRQELIFHTLPDILDLVMICVEAGVSMDAALIRATDIPQFDNNPLAEEIKVVTRETRAGKPRIEALKDMAERTMVDDVRLFVTMLAQTERFGTSLSQALRTFADELRLKRRQIAEEAAAKTTIKIIFPLILFIFPALLVVILGPAMVQISKIFK